MARQTFQFHTPSFGDEEFEILPSYDHQSNTNTSSSSAPSLHTLPIATNQSNHWQIHSGDISTGSENTTMSDNNMTNNDDHSTGRFISAMPTEDVISKMKKKRDPNEPPKPVSAYALFFRDTQAAIKGQNPDASFAEISKIVASMWDALDPEHKNVYKKKTELAKKEYLKSLAAYRASVLGKGEEVNNTNNVQDNVAPTSLPDGSNSNNAAIIQVKSVDTNVSSPVVNVVTVSRVPSQDSLQSVTANNQTITSHVTQVNTTSDNSLQSQTNLASPNTVTNQSADALESVQVQKCMRDGCNNKAVVNPDWEDEYCSNECVIIHCRDVFTHWVQANNNISTESYPTTA